MSATHCKGCGLAISWCCCSQISPQQSELEIALLLHENEPDRPTSTSKIIQKSLPNCQSYIWQRKAPPTILIERIQDPDVDCWLLFPADRPELLPRKKQFPNTASNKRTLVIVPDGTWKEVRKIIRKSPWLDKLPLLAFDPQTPSRYDLRRNPDADHLCTAETVIELLKLTADNSPVLTLENAFNLFMEGYKASKRN